jgi:hypothetical protein
MNPKPTSKCSPILRPVYIVLNFGTCDMFTILILPIHKGRAQINLVPDHMYQFYLPYQRFSIVYNRSEGTTGPQVPIVSVP